MDRCPFIRLFTSCVDPNYSSVSPSRAPLIRRDAPGSLETNVEIDFFFFVLMYTLILLPFRSTRNHRTTDGGSGPVVTTLGQQRYRRRTGRASERDDDNYAADDFRFDRFGAVSRCARPIGGRAPGAIGGRGAVRARALVTVVSLFWATVWRTTNGKTTKKARAIKTYALWTVDHRSDARAGGSMSECSDESKENVFFFLPLKKTISEQRT